jgi:hypothetical protein
MHEAQCHCCHKTKLENSQCTIPIAHRRPAQRTKRKALRTMPDAHRTMHNPHFFSAMNVKRLTLCQVEREYRFTKPRKISHFMTTINKKTEEKLCCLLVGNGGHNMFCTWEKRKRLLAKTPVTKQEKSCVGECAEW